MSNMTPRDYVIWLHGMMELIGDRLPTQAEWSMLKERHDSQFGSVVAYDMLAQIEKDKKDAAIKANDKAIQDLQAEMLKAQRQARQATFQPRLGGTGMSSSGQIYGETNGPTY